MSIYHYILILLAVGLTSGASSIGAIYAMSKYHEYRRKKEFKQAMEDPEKFREFVERKFKELLPDAKIEEVSAETIRGKIKSGKEESLFHFRNTSGKMDQVKIIVDYDMSEADALKCIEDGKNLGGDSEFIFSGESAMRMRSQGLSTDEVVQKLLIEQGRMDDPKTN